MENKDKIQIEHFQKISVYVAKFIQGWRFVYREEGRKGHALPIEMYNGYENDMKWHENETQYVQACSFNMFWSPCCTQSLPVSCKHWVVPLIST